MRILAIDPGCNAGWATWDGSHVESGVQVFDLKRGESPGMRFLRFWAWLRDLTQPLQYQRPCPSCGNAQALGHFEDGEPYGRCPACGELATCPSPPLFVYEQAHHRGGYATELLVGMTTRIQEFAAKIGAEYEGVHTGTPKKWATGNGRASKEDMILAANHRAFDIAAGVKHEQRIDPKPGSRRITDDNEADALLLLAWAKENVDADAPVPEA